jgi:predicted glycoside hydrolase/deacetylase ChbG (UPF0249 family)
VPAWKKGNSILFICADDFGISPGVNRGIIELAEAGLLTHVSCITAFSDWITECAPLAALRTKVDFGLHLIFSLRPSQPSLPFQYLRFCEALGQAPAFLDSHQHRHLRPYYFPSLQSLFTEMRIPSPLRGYQHLLSFQPGLKARSKNKMLEILFRTQREKMKDFLLLNQHLFGLEFYREDMSFSEWFGQARRALENLPQGKTLWMTHPGYADEILEVRDSLVRPRNLELEFIRNPQFTSYLKRNFSRVS